MKKFKKGMKVAGTTSRGTRIGGKVVAVHATAKGEYVEVKLDDGTSVRTRPSLIEPA